MKLLCECLSCAVTLSFLLSSHLKLFVLGGFRNFIILMTYPVILDKSLLNLISSALPPLAFENIVRRHELGIFLNSKSLSATLWCVLE